MAANSSPIMEDVFHITRAIKIMYYNTLLKLFLLYLICFSYLKGSAQDVEQIIKSDPFKVSGNISAGSQIFTSNNDTNIRSPFSYYAQGRLNLKFYHVQIPISLSFRDSKLNLSKSVSRIGINPKYKWVQLYFGSNNFQFSPYTLAGQNINGLGVELTPGKFRLTAARGTIRNIIPQTTNLGLESDFLPTYKRRATALKLGYISNAGKLQLTILKVKDDLISGEIVPDSLNEIIRPEENIVTGIQSEATIGKIFTLGIDINASVFTNDVRNDSLGITEAYQGITAATLTPTISTRASFAGEAHASMSLGPLLLGIKIKQVNPHYKSLGLFYIQNDFRNITPNLRIGLAANKLILSGSYGIQENNLDGNRSFTQKRNIYSAQLNYNSNKAFGVSANYSNYTQDQTPGIIAVEDTLRYAQVSKNLSIIPRLIFTNESTNQSITLSLVRFGFTDLSTYFDVPRNISSQIYHLNYSVKWKGAGIGFNLGGNYNKTNSIDNELRRYGGTLGLSKSFSKTTRLKLSSTYNLRKSEMESNGVVLLNRISFRLSPKKKQGLSINLSNVRRSFSNKSALSELRGSLTYNISFGHI